MRWATITIAYREIDFIKGAIQHRLDLGFKPEEILVMVSEKPFYGKEVEDDGTLEYLYESDVNSVEGFWVQDDPMLNCGMKLLQEYDWVLFLAPDEFITKDDFKKLKQFCEKGDKQGYAISNMKTYFKTWKHRIEPPEKYEPIVAVKSSTKFVDLRSIEGNNWGRLPDDIVLYHFSYFRPDYKIKQKLDNFSHAPIILKNWYEDVWLKWTADMKDFHPTHPDQYKGVVLDEPPTEIAEYLCSHSLFNK